MEKSYDLIRTKLRNYYTIECIHGHLSDTQENMEKMIYTYKAFKDSNIEPPSYDIINNLYNMAKDVMMNLSQTVLYGNAMEKSEYNQILKEYKEAQSIIPSLEFIDFINIQIKVLENYLSVTSEKYRENEKTETATLDELKKAAENERKRFLEKIINGFEYLEEREITLKDVNALDEDKDQPSAIPPKYPKPLYPKNK